MRLDRHITFRRLMVQTLFVILGCSMVAAGAIAEDWVVSEAIPVTNTDSESVPPKLEQDPHGYYQYHIQHVLSGEAFNAKKSVKAWRLKEAFRDKEKRKGRIPDWLIDIIEFFENNAQRFASLAKAIEFVLWAGLIILVVYLFVHYRKTIQQFVANLGASSATVELPATIFGLDVSKESLPDDVVATAHKLWQQGQSRDSFSLLFRGTLSKLLHDYACDFQAGDTEIECCQRVAQLNNPPLYQFMQRLTAGWQQLAYAHQVPTTETFESLCQTWQQVFDAR